MVTPPFEPVAAAVAVRKVKNLLTGMPATDADVMTATTMGAAGMQTLINTWMTDSQYTALFQAKMVTFFRNFFQQTGFAPLDDFKPQLLVNGGFDFGPFGLGAVGDDAYYRLVQNLQDSFALTAWQTVAEGKPFTDVLTTQRFMMTTGLKSLYVQTETKADAPTYGTNTNMPAWTVNFDRTNTANVNNLTADLASMVFSDQAATDDRVGIRRQLGLHGGDDGAASTGRRCCSSGSSGSRRGSRSWPTRSASSTRRSRTSRRRTCRDWKWVTINHKATPTRSDGGDRSRTTFRPWRRRRR